MKFRAAFGLCLVGSSLGLGTTEAKAGLFGHCRQKRQVVCVPPVYASPCPQVQGPPQAQAPAQVLPAPSQDPVTFLLGVVTRQQAFTVQTPNGVQTFRLQLVPSQ